MSVSLIYGLPVTALQFHQVDKFVTNGNMLWIIRMKRSDIIYKE